MITIVQINKNKFKFNEIPKAEDTIINIDSTVDKQ